MLKNLHEQLTGTVLEISQFNVIQDSDILIVDASISFITFILNRADEIFEQDDKPMFRKLAKFKLNFGAVLVKLCEYTKITTSSTNLNDVVKSKVCSTVILLMQKKSIVGLVDDHQTRTLLCSFMMEWNSVFGLVI